MSTAKALGAALGSTMLLSSSMNAMSITNRDDSDHVLIVTAGDEADAIWVRAGSTIECACTEYCLVSLLGAAEPTDARSGDRFVVHGGKLRRLV